MATRVNKNGRRLNPSADGNRASSDRFWHLQQGWRRVSPSALTRRQTDSLSVQLCNLITSARGRPRAAAVHLSGIFELHPSFPPLIFVIKPRDVENGGYEECSRLSAICQGLYINIAATPIVERVLCSLQATVFAADDPHDVVRVWVEEFSSCPGNFFVSTNMSTLIVNCNSCQLIP